MTRFVTFATGPDKTVPVNPDHVAYLLPGAGPGTVALVFGAVAGGLHEVQVLGDRESVLAQLEIPALTLVERPDPVTPPAPLPAPDAEIAPAAPADAVVAAEKPRPRAQTRPKRKGRRR